MPDVKIKEHPILFSSSMIHAIRAGRKTQTRRIIKDLTFTPDFTEIGVGKRAKYYGNENHFKRGATIDFQPYGKPGDRLWVRESFLHLREGEINYLGLPYFYKADWNEGGGSCATHGGKWKPSIHMPRTACRILLEITSVRVERLNDISEEDAQAEGAPPTIPVDEFVKICKSAPPGHIMKSGNLRGHRLGFFGVWCQINGILSWDANPWVWVIEFKKLTS